MASMFKHLLFYVRLSEFVFGIASFALMTKYMIENPVAEEMTVRSLSALRAMLVEIHIIAVAACAYPFIITPSVLIASFVNYEAVEKSLLAVLLSAGGVISFTMAGGIILVSSDHKFILENGDVYDETQYNITGDIHFVTALTYLIDVIWTIKKMIRAHRNR